VLTERKLICQLRAGYTPDSQLCSTDNTTTYTLYFMRGLYATNELDLNSNGHLTDKCTKLRPLGFRIQMIFIMTSLLLLLLLLLLFQSCNMLANAMK